MVEDWVRMDSVNINNNTLNYNITLVDISKNDYNKDDIEIMNSTMKTWVLKMIIEDKEVKADCERFFNNWINISYTYRDKNNNFLLEVLITPEDYFNELKK